MKHNNGINPELKQKLERLKDVPARDPRAAARGRARFLAEAAALQPAPRRAAKPASRRKLVWNFALSLLVLLGLFFGGSVGAAFAAQDALPGESLYPVKLWSEDIRLAFAGNPEAQIELLLRFADTRVAEMNALAAQGQPAPQGTIERLGLHLQQAIQLAADLDDAPMQSALQQIRARLEVQEQSLAQDDHGADPVRSRAGEMLQERIRIIDDGLNDPEAFRNRMRSNQEETPVPSAPQSTMPGGAGAEETSTPGGPENEPTPTPGAPTPQPTSNPTHGQGPQATPGSGNGNRP